MKTFLFGIVFCLTLSNFIYAQEERKQEIKTIFKARNNRSHHGYYFAPVFRGTSLDGQTAMMFGVKGAWVINRTVGIGLAGYGLIPSIKKAGILPTENVRPLMGYGGIMIEPIIMSNEVIHVTFPLIMGAGWVGYSEDWSGEHSTNRNGLIDDQVFWVLEPEANLEFNVAKFFRVAAGVSYRFMQEVEMLNTDKNAFQGMNYSLTLKFGRF